MIDLRSDTVTRPSPAMLKAMAGAVVGDDVFGEDPTVKELETRVAGMFGMEAGLFCASGTMANQVAIKVHTVPGDEVICDESAHIYNYEGGGPAMNSGVSLRIIHGRKGVISGDDVRGNVKPWAEWHARSRLVVIENSCNMTGGNYYTLEQVSDIATACREHNLLFHIDGARLFNALAASGDKASGYGRHADSLFVSFCKGLGCPAGAVLLGSEDFIREARRVRKIFGGGMRQVGYLAAPALYALDNNLPLLEQDHRRAKEIGQTLEGLDYVLEVFPVHTNIVIFQLREGVNDKQFVDYLADHDIKAIAVKPQTVRFVTHLDFDDGMLEVVRGVLNGYNMK